MHVPNLFELTVFNIRTGANQHWCEELKYVVSCVCNTNKGVNFPDQNLKTCFCDIKPKVTKILKTFDYLFAPNAMKAYTIKELFTDGEYVYNLNDFGAPNNSDMKHTSGTECIVHRDYDDAPTCSKASAFSLSKWCVGRMIKLNFNETAAREVTFKRWPRLKPSTSELAMWGFMYTPRYFGDLTTTCAFCNTTIDRWEAGDDPCMSHKFTSPNCMLFKKDKTKHFHYNEQLSVPLSRTLHSPGQDADLAMYGTAEQSENYIDDNAMTSDMFNTLFTNCV